MDYYEKMRDKLSEQFLNENTWLNIGEGFIKIILILVISSFVIKLGKKIIKKFFEVRERSPLRISQRREATILRLLENILTYVVYFITFIMILEVMNIDVKALLAGAGIVGLAVGFGAQSLVKDVITGFFIILEDQFSVGDYIRIGEFEGEVLEIGLRTTKMKSATGELHVLPNGSIIEVTNFSILNSLAIVDVSIPYDSDVGLAERVISEWLADMPDRYEDMVNPPELLGIQTLNPTEVVLRIVAETLPTRHWFIGRVLRKEIRAVLDENGIESPVPRMVMYSRDEKGSIGQKQKQAE
ncbi:mechanosensitive ion channel family protein [Peribacillus cavernae]|uniref:Mechanosensitive ion channel family protein n=1 Tax=Peribacillus cavernae TaxID=1674310 RepID=A0A3S0W2A2_9BACI|nr:mechanosensitive ion channel family protein [Peribacillus cavernae]MDQ0220949.1 small conductance mechanosensitive channel [Peribacillus cavernae]RUQ24524.1 mechanosensitive ion channel family protein [Peribacillus cavernae]